MCGLSGWRAGLALASHVFENVAAHYFAPRAPLLLGLLRRGGGGRVDHLDGQNPALGLEEYYGGIAHARWIRVPTRLERAQATETPERQLTPV